MIKCSLISLKLQRGDIAYFIYIVEPENVCQKTKLIAKLSCTYDHQKRTIP